MSMTCPTNSRQPQAPMPDHRTGRPQARRLHARQWMAFAFVFGLLLWLGLSPSARAQSTAGVQAGATLGPGATLPPYRAFMPLLAYDLPDLPDQTYAAIPVLGPPVDREPEFNADLNLAMRSYISTTAPLNLVDINGPTDPDAPQLAGLLNPVRTPTIVRAYQVHEWDWSCSAVGCRGEPIANPAVTMIALAATPGEAVYLPTRGPEIHGGGYRAMVLYATADRITLTYTREDTPAIGYLVHIEEIAVESNLVALYEELHAGGRVHLPALRNGDRIGRATFATVKVVVRDTGSFMDPRSRKDWWQGFLQQ